MKGFDLLKGHLESLGGHFTHYVYFYHPESLKRAFHTCHIFLQLNHALGIYSIELIRLVANMALQTYDAKKTISPQLLLAPLEQVDHSNLFSSHTSLSLPIWEVV